VTSYRLVNAGDSVIVIEFDERIDSAVNARTIACANALQAAALAGVRDIVPTYRSVAVYFDPLRTDGDALLARLDREARNAKESRATATDPVRIPVCYGGEFGPDLDAMAAFAQMDEMAVVQAHAAGVYRVFMVGFVAGFAYLGTVDPRIAMPRRVSPRVRVPAGSVGVAGPQTGIYPIETPGGWQLIGRTPVKPFDARRKEPFLLKAGDAVRFYPIDREEFDAWTA
jgi:inhibitor of KinA